MGGSGQGEENLLVSAPTEDIEHNGDGKCRDLHKEGAEEDSVPVYDEDEVDCGYVVVSHNDVENEEDGEEPEVQEEEVEGKELEEEEKESSYDDEVAPEANEQDQAVENDEDDVQNKESGVKDGELEHFGKGAKKHGGKIVNSLHKEVLKDGEGITEEDDVGVEPAKKKVKGF